VPHLLGGLGKADGLRSRKGGNSKLILSQFKKELNLRGDGDMNREAELELLSHPEKWPHRGLLPLARRGGNIIYGKKDAGIVMENDLCCV
jgi:hypothetical protein